MTKALAIYWLAGCLIIGTGVGAYKNSCPRDTTPNAQEYFFGVVVWPALLSRALTDTTPLVCEKLP